MILITGGLGFIGVHTVQALLDAGETCVLTQYRNKLIPSFLAEEIGKRIFIVPCNLSVPGALNAALLPYKITGIIHLAGARIGTLPILEELLTNITGLLEVLAFGQARQVSRIVIASSIGVYADGPASPFQESALLSVTSPGSIPAVKKCFELIGNIVAKQTGMSIVFARPSAIWGPLGRSRSPFFSAPQLIHAAVKGTEETVYAGDGIDMCYVKDCSRALALLATVRQLNYHTYNIGSGRITTNREMVAAIEKVIALPATRVLEGCQFTHGYYLDTARLYEDTGFRPAYDITRGVEEYIRWLQAGYEN